MLGLLLAASLPAQSRAPAQPDAEALRLLRQTVAEQARQPDRIIRTPLDDTPPAAKAPAPPPTPRSAAAAELERRFLAGKMSAREYEKALGRLQLASPSNAPNTRVKPARDAASPKATVGSPAKPDPALPKPPTERQKKISEVESRLDDMIRAKEARERAAQTNATPAADPGKKLTKRERLDLLLRQVVQGKLSDEEYKKERARILAEPE